MTDGGINTYTGTCWICQGVATEVLVFIAFAVLVTAIAISYEWLFFYFAAAAAWVILAVYELGLAAGGSPHWGIGLLAILMALLFAFLPFVRREDTSEGQQETYMQRLSREEAEEDFDTWQDNREARGRKDVGDAKNYG